MDKKTKEAAGLIGVLLVLVGYGFLCRGLWMLLPALGVIAAGLGVAFLGWCICAASGDRRNE